MVGWLYCCGSVVRQSIMAEGVMNQSCSSQGVQEAARERERKRERQRRRVRDKTPSKLRPR
jgi:hypothetical protein